MVRKETKLRPSITWSDLSLLINAADLHIKQCVEIGKVTLDTVRLMQVKEYCESFKPDIAERDTLERLMAKYGVINNSLESEPVETTAVSNLINTGPENLAVSPLDNAELTDEQRFDIIKLKGESKYTEAEKVFMLNVGTLIMMQRMVKKPIGANDL